MTTPRPAGDGERCTCGRTRRACDAAFLSYYDADHPAAPAPWLATPSEPTVEAELAELADLREKVARVEALLQQWRCTWEMRARDEHAPGCPRCEILAALGLSDRKAGRR